LVMISGRQLDLLGELSFRFGDGALQVTATNAELDRDVSRVVLAIYERRAGLLDDVGHLLQRNASAIGRTYRNIGNGIDVFAVLREVADNNIESAFSVEYLCYGLTAYRGLNDTVHVIGKNSIPGGALAIHSNEKVWLAQFADHAEVFHAWNGPHHFCDLV